MLGNALRCGTQVASRALNKEVEILSAHDHWREGVALPFFGSFLVSVRAVQEIVFVPFADNAAEVVVFFLEIQAVAHATGAYPKKHSLRVRAFPACVQLSTEARARQPG